MIKYSITLFEKKTVSKINVLNKERYPIYLRFIYKRKVVSVKSRVFDAYEWLPEDEYLNSYNTLKAREEDVIEKIVSKIIEENAILSSEKFKLYYTKYSKNVINKISEQLIHDIYYDLLDKYPLFSLLLYKNRENVSIMEILLLLRELNVLDKIGRQLSNSLFFIVRYIHENNFIEIDRFISDTIDHTWGTTVNRTFEEGALEYLIQNKQDGYIPLIDFLDEELANRLIHEISMGSSFSDDNSDKPVYEENKRGLETFYSNLKSIV